MRAVKLLLVAVLTLHACQRSEDRYLKRPVASSELIGLWTMESRSVADLRHVGYTAAIDPLQHTILLRADGTCHFHTFTDALEADGRASSPVDAECTWSVDSNNRRQKVTIALGGDKPYIAMYGIAEENDQFLLWQHADDPDAWRYVDFSREASKGRTR
jgi:hypothetical protein